MQRVGEGSRRSLSRWSFVSGHDLPGSPATGLRRWGGFSHAVSAAKCVRALAPAGQPFRESDFLYSFRILFMPFIVVAVSAFLAGCHSYHIDTTIENRTRAPIQLLEVDYPSASFGTDRLSEGEAFHYRFQVRGSGPLTISYADLSGTQVHITGPKLIENQQGLLEIRLLPGGKADFLPRLSPSSQP
jgi:hypothetical protein